MTTTLDFMELLPGSRVFRDQPMWRAITDRFTFIITKDEERFSASAKTLGTKPFNSTHHVLGGYGAHATLDDAKKACNDFYNKHNT